MVHLEKYLKYKQKYLDLKNKINLIQNGGASVGFNQNLELPTSVASFRIIIADLNNDKIPFLFSRNGTSPSNKGNSYYLVSTPFIPAHPERTVGRNNAYVKPRAARPAQVRNLRYLLKNLSRDGFLNYALFPRQLFALRFQTIEELARESRVTIPEWVRTNVVPYLIPYLDIGADRFYYHYVINDSEPNILKVRIDGTSKLSLIGGRRLIDSTGDYIENEIDMIYRVFREKLFSDLPAVSMGGLFHTATNHKPNHIYIVGDIRNNVNELERIYFINISIDDFYKIITRHWGPNSLYSELFDLTSINDDQIDQSNRLSDESRNDIAMLSGQANHNALPGAGDELARAGLAPAGSGGGGSGSGGGGSGGGNPSNSSGGGMYEGSGAGGDPIASSGGAIVRDLRTDTTAW
jgi:hypothetical protein